MRAFGKKPMTWQKWGKIVTKKTGRHPPLWQSAGWGYHQYRAEHFRLVLLEAADVLVDWYNLTVLDFQTKYGLEAVTKESYGDHNVEALNIVWFEEQLRLSAGSGE